MRALSDQFPFPSLECARNELLRDPSVRRIPHDEQERILKMVWERGREVARDFFPRVVAADFFSVCSDAGLKVVQEDSKPVAGRRFFAHYQPKHSLITLNTPSLQLWADYYSMELQQASNMALCHEYFHFLEWTRIGLMSRELDIPLFRCGALRIGRVRFPSLSEIGAYGFTYQCFYSSAQGEEN